jgi:hypothetical protein
MAHELMGGEAFRRKIMVQGRALISKMMQPPNGTQKAWGGPRGGAGELLRDGPQIKAAVDEVLNPAKVSMGVLLAAECVMSVGQRDLGVAQKGVDRQEAEC